MIHIAENQGKGSWIPEGMELPVALIGLLFVVAVIAFAKWRQR